MDITLAVVGFTLLMATFLGLVFFGISASQKKAYERVRLEGQRYVAVIKELHPMRGDRGHVALLLKLETPSGPVGKRLIVPLEGAVTWDFLMTARVTERPVAVHCLLSPIVEEAVTQFGFVLEGTPG
ncbi:hypothetical protein MYSTI_02162 [Myxococcus stipitatus DSM 14675]|uniref:Uncharacterized protein n=1 Tax=Myxococcus stipitatus (strain DSM 14675 / JCM 12634 / Mx s8) TaxID=1278073 RepID=L7UAM5_MYXSD|nr:hypothetical protein [Myxococcus stipitatus]AGC43489.1 hypothetical protein MYSTI_02162 [Myxococcus stipitatus DSM 14675]